MTALVIETGKHRGKRFNLPEKECVIGRQEGCAVRLTSGDVSKMHCMVKATADGLVIRDLGSRNGTLVNDQPVTEPTLVKPGDTIRIGPMTFRVVASPPKAAATPAHGSDQPDTPGKPEPDTAKPIATKLQSSQPKSPRPSQPQPSQPQPSRAEPSADSLSEDDIAALLTEGPDGLSGDTTVELKATSATDPGGTAPSGGPRLDPAVIQRAAAVIRRWHQDHANGG